MSAAYNYPVTMLCLTLLLVSFSTVNSFAEDNLTQDLVPWETVEAIGEPTARHEASLVAYKDKLYLIGGRGVKPIDVYDPRTNRWTTASETPLELHHFQAVVYGDGIYLIGAMTGGWPTEHPIGKVIVYYPETDKFEFLHHIPESRRRGGAGVVVYNEKIYIIGGIVNGHMDGYQPWLDSYDPKTGDWTPLADANNARDHFQAVVINDKIYACAGRTTSQKTNQGFDLTVGKCDVYDLKINAWQTEEIMPDLPSPRAGNMAIELHGKLVIGGGECGLTHFAHNEIEVFDPSDNTWTQYQNLQRGRHGTGFAIVGNYLYTASGSGNRGGGPELNSLERLRLLPAE